MYGGSDGTLVGSAVGLGFFVGECDGNREGITDGNREGIEVGLQVGEELGLIDGLDDGAGVGEPMQV